MKWKPYEVLFKIKFIIYTRRFNPSYEMEALRRISGDVRRGDHHAVSILLMKWKPYEEDIWQRAAHQAIEFQSFL